MLSCADLNVDSFPVFISSCVQIPVSKIFEWSKEVLQYLVKRRGRVEDEEGEGGGEGEGEGEGEWEGWRGMGRDGEERERY